MTLISNPQVGQSRDVGAVTGVGLPQGALVFSPGNPNPGVGSNIFTSWAALYAAIQQNAGEQQSILFDDRYAGVCQIPAPPVPGTTYNMFNVTWRNVGENNSVLVDIADGVRFVCLPVAATPGKQVLQIDGAGLLIRCNRVGPICPFDNTDQSFGGVQCFGPTTRFFNTIPGALPMFKAGPTGMFFIFDGAGGRNGFGRLPFGSPGSPAPVVDCAGGIVFIGHWAGQTTNNCFTDSVGGGAVQVNPTDDSVSCDQFQGWLNPALIAGGGVFMFGGVLSNYTTLQQSRYRVRSHLGVIAIATAGNYTAAYNECVFCDTSGGPILATLPSAQVEAGDFVTLKDRAGNAAVSNITAVPRGGDIIENPVISTAHGSRTWVSDGLGHWNLIGSV